MVGQITLGGGQAVIGGTASLDLQAFNALGLPASGAWPKLTGDWTIATPTLGSYGPTTRCSRCSGCRMGMSPDVRCGS